MIKEYYGFYQAFVSDIKDPEKRGRVKVLCPEILGDAVSGWCEPCFPCAIDDGGDFYVPPVDEAVYVSFINGDVNRPVYFGGWWSSESTPLGSNYNEPDKVRLIGFSNCLIALKENSISISCGEKTSIEIQDSNVTIKGEVNISDTANLNGAVNIKGTELTSLIRSIAQEEVSKAL